MNKLIVIEKEEAQEESSSLLVMQVDMIKYAVHVILSVLVKEGDWSELMILVFEKIKHSGYTVVGKSLLYFV